MNLRPLFLTTFALAAVLLSAAAHTHKLEAVDKLPEGLAKPIADQLDPAGQQVVGANGAVVTVWLAKGVEVKADFKPSLSVKYPFAPGQLIGAIRVAESGGATDFRGQEIAAGVYTLRYGQQPQDGNHLGTSELADFLLALPADEDKDAKPITSFDDLSEKSAKSAGSTHPAIFSLLPAEKGGKASLTHDEGSEFWILNLTASGKAGGKAVEVPIRMVVIGVSEG